MSKNVLAGIIGAVVVIGGLAIGGGVGFAGMSHVSTGYVGIAKHTNGSITEVPAGWHWTGFAVSVQEYPTYVQSLILSDNPKEGSKQNDQWQVGTSDQQELPVNTNYTWSINVKDAASIYQAVGGQNISYVQDKIVQPTMKTVVNKITHKYGWNDIKGAKQAQVTAEINQELEAELGKVGIKSGVFGFSYVGSPKGMEQAQQALASAELSTKQAQAAQEKAKVENQTKLMNAQTDAQAAEIEAQGVKAKADAMNQLTIQEEAINKWNGALPTTMSNNVIPFIGNATGTTK